MATQPINPVFLEEDELNYELQIRDLQTVGTLTAKRRALRYKMRDEFQSGDNLEELVPPKDIVVTEETKLCQVKLKSIENIYFKQPQKRTDADSLILKTKLHHLNYRLKRLQPETEPDQALIQELLLDIDEMLLTLQEIETIEVRESADTVFQHNVTGTVEEERSQLFEQFLEKFSLLPTPSASPSGATKELASKQELLPKRSDINKSNQSDVRSSKRSYMKTISIQKWGVIFHGRNEGLSLKDFLSQIKIWAHSQHVSDEELLASAFLFFEGEAKIWYRAFYNKFKSWTELVRSLEMQFLPTDYDYLLKREIENRLQGPNENFGIYLASMEMLFKNLSQPLSEAEQLKIVRHNMLSHYKPGMSFMPVTTMKQLLSCCRIIDDTKEEICRQQSSVSYSKNFLEPAFSNPSTKRKPKINELEYDKVDVPDEVELNTVKKSTNITVVKCYNCGRTGHHFRDCKSTKTTFCYRCGTKDVYLSNCPKCKPSENREVKSIESGAALISRD